MEEQEERDEQEEKMTIEESCSLNGLLSSLAQISQ